jgi:CheY-like chemotaxis protein
MNTADKASGLLILVVEDESLLRRMVVAHLREAGCLVIEASSAEQAMAYLGKPIDILFTDLRLGGALNGWDIAEAHRRANEDLGVIYATGNPIEPQRPVSGSLTLTKPYDLENVLEVFVGVIDRPGRNSPSLPGNA